jgi:hypothetical protein
MIHKPLYHGCVDAHGAVPSPDGRLLATSGRGSSNIYLIDAVEKRVIGNTPNPAAGPSTGTERLSSGLLLDISAQDKPGFTPFMKTTPDGAEAWFSHKLADAPSCRSTQGGFDLLDSVPLGMGARPNHVEFVANARGSVVYASLARVDDDDPGGTAARQIAIIDRAARPGAHKVVGHFFTRAARRMGCGPTPSRHGAHDAGHAPATAARSTPTSWP